jgi:RNA polymerase sigma factor (sigma-70 family)
MDVAKSFGKTVSVAPERQQEASADWVAVQKVQAGDVAAFDPLILKYRERVYSVIYNLTSNREDASDLTQDTFIKAFKSITRFKGKSSFFTWLYRIAVNSTLTHLKKNRFRHFFSFEKITEEDKSGEFIEGLVANSTSDKDTLINELQEKLNEALQKLSFNHRTVVSLFEIDQLSHKEIAEVVGCTEGTVRSRLHYAKQELQALLHDYLK